MDRQRIDKWLWHARVVRTRSAAAALSDSGLVRILEIWETREHLDRHLKAPHMMPWRAALAELGASGRDIKIYRVEGEGEPV